MTQNLGATDLEREFVSFHLTFDASAVCTALLRDQAVMDIRAFPTSDTLGSHRIEPK